MAELVDATDSKSVVGDNVSVRFRPPVPQLLFIFSNRFWCGSQCLGHPCVLWVDLFKFRILYVLEGVLEVEDDIGLF